MNTGKVLKYVRSLFLEKVRTKRVERMYYVPAMRFML